MEKGLLIYVILGVLVWAILGTVVAAYYFHQYDTYQREYSNLADQFASISIKVNIFLSYGNGTKVWHNNTVIPLGATAFNATYSVAEDVKHTDYGGELGIIVTSINGLANNSTHGWLYWYYDSGNLGWMGLQQSCAKHILHEGDIIALTYESYIPWPEKPT